MDDYERRTWAWTIALAFILAVLAARLLLVTGPQADAVQGRHLANEEYKRLSNAHIAANGKGAEPFARIEYKGNSYCTGTINGKLVRSCPGD